MVYIYNINNTDKLFKFLDSCKDELQIVMPDGNIYDWQSCGGVVKPLLQKLAIEKVERLELRCTDENDTICMLRFLMEATKEAKAS